MFKQYDEICDVVSLLPYCPSERTYLLNKDTNGEYWLTSCKSDKVSWNMSAQRMNIELFGSDASTCQPLQVVKTWLPNHKNACVYHAVYKVPVKYDVKKKAKFKNVTGTRNRQWVNSVELERLRAHSCLRSPEIAVYAAMAVGDHCKDQDNQEIKSSMLVEICEENTLIGGSGSTGSLVGIALQHFQLLAAANYKKDELEPSMLVEICVEIWLIGPKCAGSLVSVALQHCQLSAAANYKKDDQIRMYVEFTQMAYPAQYLSPHQFRQFMVDLGWQYQQCMALFRAADIMNHGGLSFQDLLFWMAALEPGTQHSGSTAEIRCKYIFRYFDSDRDMKLEYAEFKEMIAAARATRQLPIDALSVARDADNVYRQLGMQPNAQLPLSEFMRCVGETRLRGTSGMLRAPRSIANYLVDLQQMKQTRPLIDMRDTFNFPAKTPVRTTGQQTERESGRRAAGRPASGARRQDYAVAAHTVRVRRHEPSGLLELLSFNTDAVTPSTLNVINSPSLDLLGPTAAPVEALAAVRYFATTIRRGSTASSTSAVPASSKSAWSWACSAEEAVMGALILKLADAVAPICANEPRMLRIQSPIYVVGDLHGNLHALLAMETAFWPMGPALAPAHFLFLGDYVDRGPHGSELIAYLLAAKLQRPKAVLLIRGNHETRDIQKMFTFYAECLSKYGEVEGLRVWTAINHVFDALPLAAVVDDKVFCCHGGIPPPWVCPLISAIDKVPVPLPRPAEQSSIAWELLWNDPVKSNKTTVTLAMELAANEGFAANAKRGTGHIFNQNALDRFLAANQLSHVLRAHEVHQSGFMCQLRGRLVSVFSSSRYCGGTNDSGIALLEDGKLRLLRVNAD